MLTVEFGAFPMRVAVGNVSIVPRRQGVSDRSKNMETKLFSFVDGIDGHGFYTILEPSSMYASLLKLPPRSSSFF